MTVKVNFPSGVTPWAHAQGFHKVRDIDLLDGSVLWRGEKVVLVNQFTGEERVIKEGFVADDEDDEEEEEDLWGEEEEGEDLEDEVEEEEDLWVEEEDDEDLWEDEDDDDDEDEW